MTPIVAWALLASQQLAASPGSWATHMEPAAAATVDVDAAVGVAYVSSVAAGPVPFTPAIALGARWGIIDNVQLAFPLLLTGSFRVDNDVAPLRLAVTGGVGGVGYSNVEGAIVQPVLAATASSVGRRGAAFATVDVGADTRDLDLVSSGVGVGAGFAFRLSDRLSVGFSGRVASAHFFGRGGDDALLVGVGSHGAGVPADVPTVRFVLSDAVSLELWSFADFAIGGATSVGALAGATYHLGY